MKKKLYTIILNWNGKEDTLACLESLKHVYTHHIQMTTVVVDNASHDGSVEAIKEKFPNVEIVQNTENFGFAKGNNRGIEYALQQGADYLFILNNDTLVNKYCIEEMVHIAQLHKHVGIVSPKIYFAPGFEYHKDRYSEHEKGKVLWYAGGQIDWNNVYGVHRGVDEVDKRQYDTVDQLDFASGCAVLVKREVFERVGMFDEKFFLYFEDTDLSMRVKKAGFTILFAPKAIVWHKNAGSAGGSGSKLQDYYTTRNRMLFGMRYAPLRTKIALVRESLRLLKSGREWQKQGIKDFYLGKFGKGRYKA